MFVDGSADERIGQLAYLQLSKVSLKSRSFELESLEGTVSLSHDLGLLRFTLGYHLPEHVLDLLAFRDQTFLLFVRLLLDLHGNHARTYAEREIWSERAREEEASVSTHSVRRW